MGKNNKYELVKNLDRKQRVLLQLGRLSPEFVKKIKPFPRLKRNKQHSSASIEETLNEDSKGACKATSSTTSRIKSKKRKQTMLDKNGANLEPASKHAASIETLIEDFKDACKATSSTTSRIKSKKRKQTRLDDNGANLEPASKLVKHNDLEDDEKSAVEECSSELSVKPAKTINPKNRSLRERVSEKLKGARFRFINENLYTKSSAEAAQMFAEDPSAFHTYHEGYNMQKAGWPIDPLDMIIKQLKKLKHKVIIADMGCGDARLSQSVSHHKVYSFDLIALNDKVTSCDMSDVPLENESVDICVYCLSLMGTNISDYLVEANRILKLKGTLKIVEIASRFVSKKDFRRNVEKLGFQLIKQTEPNDYFVQMDFEKVGKVKNKRPPGLTLKPCLYKKR